MSQLQSSSHPDMDIDNAYPPFLDFGKIRPLRHKWTGPQCEVLCVLRQFYTYTKKEEAAIFNYLFEAEIEGDFRNGLPARTINTQWQSMLGRKHPIWISVNAISPSNDKEYKECRHIIELASTELNLHIRRKNHDNSRINVYPEFQLLHSFFRTGTNAEPDPDTAAHLDEPEMDIAPRCECAVEFEKPSTKSRYGIQPKPQILYRFFNSQSNGMNNPQYFASGLACTQHPAFYNHHDIETMAITHLSRFEVNTPFISTFATLLPCVHRMLTKSQSANVSIIDASQLNQNMIFSAADILRKYPLSSDITARYFGWSEWLIWREIPESSIVCTIAESELLEIAKAHDDISSVLQIADITSYKTHALHSRLKKSPTKLDKPAGMTVGKFLKLINLPAEYIEQVAKKIAHGWRFTRTTQYFRYDEFLEGVHLGYDYSAPNGLKLTSENNMACTTPPIIPEKSNLNAEVIVIDDDTDVEVKYGQEVVVIDDEEEHVEVVAVEGEGLDEVEIVAVECEDIANHTDNNHEQVAMDRFQDKLPRTLESESDIADGIMLTQTPEATYQWEPVQIEMGGTGNEAIASMFELDRERVNQIMGW
ncbi:hypothetical protein AJ78_01841 [Emergomyces pasteurianus Ep9510]|uniref:DUF7587 domain-containing protein n=1 Tax=Emergomyces pasteurianus Ep9510 TaxID=1447872 RepID=A0A1J9QD54_9EURO|nr:hypothetical protein AJ78_01841 [Emergomyces pasteurianus Ep9510]